MTLGNTTSIKKH